MPQAHPRVAAVRPLAPRQHVRRHLRAGQLLSPTSRSGSSSAGAARGTRLPAAHGAAIFFDLLTLAGLYLLGRRLRGNSLGVVLAYCWAAYPVHAVRAELQHQRQPRRGGDCVRAARHPLGAGARRDGAGGGSDQVRPASRWRRCCCAGTEERLRERHIVGVRDRLRARRASSPCSRSCSTHDLRRFWRDSILYQSDRTTPFSIWGLWGGLGWRPEPAAGRGDRAGARCRPSCRRGGPWWTWRPWAPAILIALQLTLNYWLYPYIVWFFPLAWSLWSPVHPPATSARRRRRRRARPPTPAPVRIHIASP